MAWIRASDDFYDNDKLVDVGPLGVAMHFAAIGFCNRYLTDGFIKKSKARLLLDFDEISVAGVEGAELAKVVAESMLTAGLWHEAGHDCEKCHARTDGGKPRRGEYLIHDYLEFQPSRAEVETKAEANRERVRRFREQKRASSNGGNRARNGEGNALRAEAVIPQPKTQNPSSSLVETLGGGVTKDDAREDISPRPQCPDHEENHTGPCRACERRRKWDEAHADELKTNELERKRAAKEAATRLRENCPRCKGTNTYEDADGVHPCQPHQEAAHA